MKPLEGIRIADFTVHNAGPFCTHLLSQLGAEVIKVESAMRPDAFRKPHPVYGREGPATFDQVASNKLSVRMNLKKPEGVALARRLVAASDVAAESFRPGVMARLGLGYDALKSVREDIVLLSISSSGQSGPDAHFAGYAPLFGAWGGLGELTGYADGPPGGGAPRDGSHRRDERGCRVDGGSSPSPPDGPGRTR
ncbi:CoA transferase [Novosphingobium sp. HII-3]|uniref:CoA transferase n=1 Tax=Novosphingobium sp. HII-3 TaxID=2075565 RepID=UPI0018EBB832|nr:CoA transferase [Novosphingobium sp. HII-3]